jgi:hypothetical protein
MYYLVRATYGRVAGRLCSRYTVGICYVVVGRRLAKYTYCAKRANTNITKHIEYLTPYYSNMHN